MIWILIALAMAERPSKLPKSFVRGKQLYDQYCFQCHGATGLADNELAKNLQAPALAGRIQSEQYKQAINIIQQGKGMMPAYEMLFDRHDSKRILNYLARLDQETGIDPNPKDYESENKKKDAKKKDKKKPLPPSVNADKGTPKSTTKPTVPPIQEKQ